MASEKREAPVCPGCGRSEGVTTSIEGACVWRRGAWRWDGPPDVSRLGNGDMFCENCDEPYSE